MSIITEVPSKYQLQENPGIDDDSRIETLREWTRQHPYLPKLSQNDLTFFYLTNFCNLHLAISHVSNYFIMRHYLPEFFINQNDLDSPELKEFFEAVLIVTLPKRTKTNVKVIFQRMMDSDPKKYSFEAAVKLMNMVIDSGIREDGPDNKYIFVYDLSNATVEHCTKASRWALKKFYEYIHKGSPIRWMGAHYIILESQNNEFIEFFKTNVVDTYFGNNDTVQFYCDLESLIKATDIERSSLPNELGGDAGTFKELQRHQMKKLESYNDYFIQLNVKNKLLSTVQIPALTDLFGPEIFFE